jgi:C1A family cysteine protease
MKNMFKLLLISLLMTPAFAATYSPVNGNYSFQEAPEYLAILAQVKAKGDFATKPSLVDTKTPTAKPMTRGEQMVAEAKARNREIIAAQNKAAASAPEIEDEWEKIKAEDKKTRDGWKQEVKDSLAQWRKEQDIFLGKIKVYQENTFVIPAPKEIIVEKKVIVNLPEVQMVNGTFNVAIRDQSARATCSAFAGIRALEIILNQNKIDKDLSEQYFYWASKPECMSSPCAQKGSWVTSAFRFSKQKNQVDIPTESNCAYAASSIDKNETQTPLPSNCNVGSAKVENYQEVRTLADVIDSLKKNTPVIMAAKLSENFYKNQGLVTLADSTTTRGVSLDNHALGHAFLAVGVMELPEKIKASEGSYCIVVANSWGKGWGAGGYACLTERWLTKFRQPAPFIAVTKVSAN